MVEAVIQTIMTIDYVTIASTGNAKDFGDLTSARQKLTLLGASNCIRGVFAGGYTTQLS